MFSRAYQSRDDPSNNGSNFEYNNRRRGPQNNRNERRDPGNNRDAPYSRRQGSPRRGNGVNSDAGKILVNNLHFNVSEGDLTELFSQVGQVRVASLNFNSRGESNGTGVVVFARQADALAAMKKYNGVTLDGLLGFYSYTHLL